MHFRYLRSRPIYPIANYASAVSSAQPYGSSLGLANPLSKVRQLGEEMWL